MVTTLRCAIISSLALVIAASALAQNPPTTVVIAHGFTTGSKGVWVQAMAQAIIARAGEGSVYRYEGSTGAWTYVPAAGGDQTTNVVVLIFNWVPESASPSPGPNWNYAQAAGDVLYAMLRDPKYAGQGGPANLLINRNVQFIGHSRGACVNSEATKRLAAANLPVDQVTTLDPHPVNGTLDSPYNYNWGDPVPQKWFNVRFADNYWRADGGGIINGLDFDGIPITNAFNTELSESALNCCAYSWSHLDVHLWYHGTIDTGPNANDGEQAVTTTMRNTWWPPGPPEGYTQRGIYYSGLGGGAALRPGPFPQGASPPAVAIVYNGDFEQGTYAGWGYHGGSVGGQIIVESGNGYLRLGAGQGGSSATHNRFFLPAAAHEIVFDYRVLTGASNESLRATLINSNGVAYDIGSISLAGPAGGWVVNAALPIGCFVQRSRNYTLRFQIMTAGGSPSSVVGIDNVRITALSSPLPGDVNGDGFVNIDDLFAVINGWGVCPSAAPTQPPSPPPPPWPYHCPADIAPTGGNGVVNIDDLFAVISGWGMCP